MRPLMVTGISFSYGSRTADSDSATRHPPRRVIEKSRVRRAERQAPRGRGGPDSGAEAESASRQQRMEPFKRQADHVGVTSFDAGDEQGAAPLQCVRPGLVEALAGPRVPGDLLLRHRSEADTGRRQV